MRRRRAEAALVRGGRSGSGGVQKMKTLVLFFRVEAISKDG